MRTTHDTTRDGDLYARARREVEHAPSGQEGLRGDVPAEDLEQDGERRRDKALAVDEEVSAVLVTIRVSTTAIIFVHL